MPPALRSVAGAAGTRAPPRAAGGGGGRGVHAPWGGRGTDAGPRATPSSELAENNLCCKEASNRSTSQPMLSASSAPAVGK